MDAFDILSNILILQHMQVWDQRASSWLLCSRGLVVLLLMFLIKDIRKITPLGKTISEMTAIIQSKIPPIQLDGFWFYVLW